jgi:hypothetical protein
MTLEDANTNVAVLDGMKFASEALKTTQAKVSLDEVSNQ